MTWGFPGGSEGSIEGIGWSGWNALNIANLDTSFDTLSFQNGSITMAGNDLVIPVSTNLSGITLIAGLGLLFPIPTGLCDGSDSLLLTRLTFASIPSFGAFGVKVGLYDPTTTAGVAGGARYATSPNMMRPVATIGSAQNDGLDLSATASMVRGVIDLPGSFDGVDTQTYACSATMNEAGVARASNIKSASASALLTSNMRLIVSIGHTGTASESGTIQIKAEYGVLDNPYA